MLCEFGCSECFGEKVGGVIRGVDFVDAEVSIGELFSDVVVLHFDVSGFLTDDGVVC